MSAIRTVQAFGRETYVKAHFDRAVEQALDAGLARVRLRGLLSGIVIFLVFSGIGVILWIGGQDLMAGRSVLVICPPLFFMQFWLQARPDFCQNLLVIFNVLLVLPNG